MLAIMLWILSSLLLFVILVLCQLPPGPPQIVGSNNYIEGQTVTLECSSSGGSPSPSVKWYEGSTLLDDTFVSLGSNKVHNTYSFVANMTMNFAVYVCHVDNGLLQSPLLTSVYIQVKENHCALSSKVGPCQSEHKRFYYDNRFGECRMFHYGGCKGNANNFETLQACLTASKHCQR